MASSPLSPTAPAAWLRAELEARIARNPRYSQRAFSRLLGVSPGKLSEILREKRAIGPRLAERLSAKLALSGEAREAWQHAVRSDRESKARLRGLSELARRSGAPEYQCLREDTLELIGSWKHLAVLNLLKTRGCRPSPAWMGKRLGLPAGETREILLRLERLGLASRAEGGWKRTGARLTTRSDIPTEALRDAHRGELALVAESLASVPVGERDVSSIYMAIPRGRMAEAKRLLASLRRGVCDALEAMGPAEEVYLLNVSLIPLTKGKGNA